MHQDKSVGITIFEFEKTHSSTPELTFQIRRSDRLDPVTMNETINESKKATLQLLLAP